MTRQRPRELKIVIARMFKETNKEPNRIRKAMDDMKEEFNKKRNTGENWVWNAGKKKTYWV